MTKAIATMPANLQALSVSRTGTNTGSKAISDQFGDLMSGSGKALRFDEKLPGTRGEGGVHGEDADLQGNMPRLARALAENAFAAGQAPRRQTVGDENEEAPTPDGETETADTQAAAQTPMVPLANGEVPVHGAIAAQAMRQSKSNDQEAQRTDGVARLAETPDAKGGTSITATPAAAANAAPQDGFDAAQIRTDRNTSTAANEPLRTSREFAASDGSALADKRTDIGPAAKPQPSAAVGASGSLPLAPALGQAPSPAVAAPATVTLSPVGQSVIDAVQSNSSWSGLLKDPVTAMQHVTKADGAVLQTLRIQLHPAELGVVRLKLRVVQDRISVEVQVDTASAGSTLAKEADVMASAMRTLGLRVDTITVWGGQGDDGAQGFVQHGMTNEDARFGGETPPDDGTDGRPDGERSGLGGDGGKTDDTGNHHRAGLYI